MKKLIHWLDEYLEISLCVALMSVMTVVIFVQVVMRYEMCIRDRVICARCWGVYPPRLVKR